MEKYLDKMFKLDKEALDKMQSGEYILRTGLLIRWAVEAYKFLKKLGLLGDLLEDIKKNEPFPGSSIMLVNFQTYFQTFVDKHQKGIEEIKEKYKNFGIFKF